MTPHRELRPISSPRERACLHGNTPPIAGVLRTLVIEIADG
jgi:hypothetical protein